jgi:hypothetical protein
MASSTPTGSENTLIMKHPKFRKVVPPESVFLNQARLFLANSIEMGKAKLWQDYLANKLLNLSINILNSRRSDFNED